MRYKLTLVIVATAILIAGSIGETLYIKNTFEEFEARTSALMGREEYDLDEVIALREYWNKKAEALEIFVSVLQLNEITVTLGELEGAVKKEDFDTASALVDRIYEYAVRISDMYMLKFNNIF